MILHDGRVLAAQQVVLATGVQPNDRPGAGHRHSLSARHRGGSPDADCARRNVYAIGECCEIDGQTFGLVAPCLAQAEILAARLADRPQGDFYSAATGTRLKVSGMALFSAGDVREALESDVVWSSWDPLTRHYRRLFLKDGRLNGVLLYGDCQQSGALLNQLHNAGPVSVNTLFGLDEPETQPQVAGQNPMTKPTLVVVGHGMVGHHFLEDCVNRNLHQQYQIVVFGEERYAAYDRVHLSEYFAGRNTASLSLVSEDFFANNGIELRSDCRVEAIDRQQRSLRDSAGRELAWDKLVLATGSYPFVPPVPGHDLPGCFVYRTLDDLDAIAACARQSQPRRGDRRRAAGAGGGQCPEAAGAGNPRGGVCAPPDGGPARQRRRGDAAQENRGAGRRRSHHVKQTEQIATQPDGSLVLRFADGEQLDTDMVVFSAGIRPRDELARSADISVGPRGGICIDDGCQTSDPDVLAIGECALWEGKIFGLVAPGYQMARVAAAALAGENKTFTGADMSTKLKLLGVDVASFGDAHGRTPGSAELPVDARPAANLQENCGQPRRQNAAGRRAGG